MLIDFFSKYADAVGMVGVFILLTAYFLLNMNKITSLNICYPLMNLFGSMFILFSLMFQWNLASVFIEIAWAVISTIGTYRALRAKVKEDKRPNNIYPLHSIKKTDTL